MPGFATDRAFDLPPTGEVPGRVTVEAHVDNGLVELGLGGGAVWVTMLHYAADVAGEASLVREARRG